MVSLTWQGNLFTIALMVLIGFGLSIIIFQAFPYLKNDIHENRIIIISALSQKVQVWLTFKIETTDLVVAGNPINVSIATGAVSGIRSIQLTFEGASTFFGSDYDFSSPDFFEKQYPKMREAISSNIINLDKSGLGFTGKIKNLRYGQGGDFDVGITVTLENGEVRGYGVGEIEYILKDMIRVSPPEALIQFRNGNIAIGLAWTAAGLTFMALGIAGIINLLMKVIINQ